jgi:hypothetical protein
MTNPQAQIVISAVDKTQVAFNNLKKNLKEVESAAGVVGGIFGRFIPALTVAGILGFGKNVIDAADGMNDLKEATGQSVERLASWRLLAEQSGTSLETLSKGLFIANKNLASNSAELAKNGITAHTAEEAIFQLSDILAALPADAPERANIAFSLLGRSAESLMPLLSQGGDALRRMVEEGAKGAKVFAELAPEADKFNDELAELKNKASIGGASIFLPLIRGANDWVDSAEKMSDGTFEAADAFTYLSGPVGTAFRNWLLDINGITIEVASAQNELAENSVRLGREYAALNSLLAIQKQRLEESRRGAQAEDVKKNVAALKEQIAGFQALGKEMQGAFITAGAAAADALQKADQFLQRARTTRQSAADRVLDIDLEDAAPDEQDAIRNQEILAALEKARSARIQADFQRLQGNTSLAEQQLDIAEQQSQRADDIGGKLKDEELARQRILEAAETLAQIDESRAKVQQQLAAAELARQESQKAAMADNEARIVDLTSRLTALNEMVSYLTNADQNIKIQMDEQAYNETLGKLQKLRAEYAALHRVNFMPGATGVTDSNGNEIFRDPLPGLATGGPIVGPGTGTSDSILARLSRGEHVLTDQEVRAAGGHDAIYRLRRALLERRLPRFANGGEVSSALARVTSTTTSPSTSSVTGMDRGVIVISGGQRVEIQAKPSEFDKLERAALMHGGLKK